MGRKDTGHTQQQNQDIETLNPQAFERLIGDVIHKVKNNLGGISGFTTLLERDLGKRSPHIRMLQQIQTSVMRLDDLAVDLMVLIRHVKTVSERVDLRNLINNCLSQYNAKNKTHCVAEYSEDLSSKELTIRSDSYALERIFRYALRFIEHAGAGLHRIGVSRSESDVFHIRMEMHHMDVQLKTDRLFEFINSDDEPVEARLTFAILVKMLSRLNASWKIESASDKSMTLVLEIS
ncbi:HAMP domain-containing histidine kinase [bacterium]|nr:HAMP domain-containing histidine kinase [bacterium]